MEVIELLLLIALLVAFWELAERLNQKHKQKQFDNAPLIIKEATVLEKNYFPDFYNDGIKYNYGVVTVKHEDDKTVSKYKVDRILFYEILPSTKVKLQIKKGCIIGVDEIF